MHEEDAKDWKSNFRIINWSTKEDGSHAECCLQLRMDEITGRYVQDFSFSNFEIFPAKYYGTDPLGIFVVSISLKVSPKFHSSLKQLYKTSYSADEDDINVKNMQMRVTTNLTYLGRTSIGRIFSFYEFGDTARKYPLVIGNQHLVHVDIHERQPTPWTSTLRMAHDQLPRSPVTKPQAFQHSEEKTYSFKVKVAGEDIDDNDHVHFTFCVTLALRCLHQACEAGLVKNFAEEFKMELQEMTILYRGEAKENDILDTSLWYSKERSLTFDVLIEKQASPVTYITLSYYQSLSGHKL